MAAHIPKGSRDSARGEILDVCLSLAALGLGLALRMFRLATPSLRGDEAFSWMIARQDPAAILRFIWEAREPHSPLHFLWMKAWMELAGDSEFALRFHALFLTFLITPLVGRWLHALGQPRRIVRLGMILASLHPYLIWQSQDARQYGTLAFFGIAEPLALMRALRTDRRRDWVLFVLIGTLGVYYHYNLLILLALQAILVSAFWRHRLRSGVIALGGILLLSVPALVLAVHALAPYSGTAQRAPSLFEGLSQVARTFTVGSTGDGWPATLATTLWALGAFLGGARLLQISRADGLWIIAHLVTPVLVAFLVAQRRAVFAPHYMITALPFWILLTSIGMGQLMTGGRRHRAFFTVCIVGIGVGVVQSLAHHYLNPRYTKSPPMRELVEALDQAAKPRDYALITFPDPTFSYYHQDGIPWGMLPASQPFRREETMAALERLAQQYDHIWLIPVHLPMWPGSEEVERWLRLHAELLEERAFGPLRLLAFRPAPRALAAMQRVEARWTDGVELVAFRITPEGEISPGGVLRISTAWRRWETVREEHSVFMHLLDEEGQLVAQDDHPVGRGLYPSIAWSEGEVIFERFEIRMPGGIAPGRYRLVIGRYNWETLVRIPIGSSDHLELEWIEVRP
ncbi:MAG: glycosyltransferase family 39 protein [Thermoflexus sp.]|uniref:glycosyltransferase family 39 protein n=1 Tax=Thermoflexus sp. TaxID=1969742 RepID=UPI0025E273EE|nr:glycosyltransferase family 39 protein [Thermoflexus sp.]MCS6964133.1 glycosyltransferase family 39 protein [Thermoflexus sp.]MCS7351334.1 glycosyltransferase family 39 protein [Thermoflexus sp.]MDW8180789.1 glycosyltransferase family 39 protein [Anaerolineae bacterium]MDW8185957.1 glycosyltransferase family 39 protein [Anaerolineae bacterium]